ncbi:MAG: RNA methyltransferase [Lentisphaeria bacterium]
MPLTKRQRKEIQQASSRHGRRKSNLFLCEGVRACCEAWQQQPQCVELVIATKSAFERDDAITEIAQQAQVRRLPIHTCSPDEMSELSSADHPQGILFLCRRYEPADPRLPLPGLFALVLDRISDPGNLGTILRTAWAAGVREVWMTRSSTDPFGPKAVRAGMGAQFGLNIHTLEHDLEKTCEQLREYGVNHIWLSDVNRGTSCYDPDFKLKNSALVIGSEAHGAADVQAASRVHIPMPGGAESLNAAQAATILMFEAVRRQL